VRQKISEASGKTMDAEQMTQRPIRTDVHFPSRGFYPDVVSLYERIRCPTAIKTDLKSVADYGISSFSAMCSGAGIYVAVRQVAGDVRGPIWVPLVVAFLLAMLTAASYAELVTNYPKAGGAAVFAQQAFEAP
jgi:hypothetical protein